MFKKFSDRLTSKITREKLDIFLKKHATSRKVLDIGSNVGIYKKYFTDTLSLDINADFKPDIVGDVHDMKMLKNSEFEVVLCTEVFEHLYNPFQAIKEIARVLKPEGNLILTTRFIYPIHDSPHDYFRFTKYGLIELLNPYFEDIKIEEEVATVETIAVLVQRLGFQSQTLHTNFLGVFWHLLAKFIRFFGFLITKEYGDIRHSRVEKHIMASGYYLSAKRKR